MFRVVVVAAALSAGFAAQAYADSFRPGSSSAGGRIGVFCNTDLLSAAEQKECISRITKAKTAEERREIIESLKGTFKARQKEADEEYERLNPGGRNGPACTGQQCQ